MAEMKTFEAIMTILDEATRPLQGIMMKLDATRVVADRTQASLDFSARLHNEGMLNNEAGMLGQIAAGAERAEGPLARTSEHTERLGAASGVLGGALVEMLPMLGGFGALASGAGLMELVHSTAEANESLQVMSKTVGISTADLQRWDYIAKMSGIGPDAMNTGLERLNKNLGMAALGKDKNLITLMHQLGIKTKDANGHLLDSAQLMPKLADAFKNIESPALRAAYANILFGRSGADLLPLLDQGSGAIDDMTKSFHKYNYQFSNTDNKNLSAFGDAWKNLISAMSGLKDDLGANLAPVFTPIVQGIADWTAVNKDWIAHDITKGIKKNLDTFKEQWSEVSPFFTKNIAMLKEQSHEIATIFDTVSPYWDSAFTKAEAEFVKFENFISPAVPDTAASNPGYAGNHPIMPKHSNLLLPSPDARAPSYASANLPGDSQLSSTIAESLYPLRNADSQNSDLLTRSFADAGSQQTSKIELTLHMPNAPPGTTTSIRSSGARVKTRLNLGRSSMAQQY